MSVLFKTAIAILTCGNTVQMATRYVTSAQETAVSFVTSGSAFLSNVSGKTLGKCTAFDGSRHTDLRVLKHFVTPFLSFDHMVLVSERTTSHEGIPVLGESDVKVGDQVVTLLSAKPRVTTKPLRKSKLIDLKDCDEAKNGTARAATLPAEERDTHPDQNVGYALWAKACEVQNQALKTIGGETFRFAKESFQLATLTVVAADPSYFILIAPNLVEGAPVFDKQTSTLLGFVTMRTPLHEKFKHLAVVRTWKIQSLGNLDKAIANGLWDY